MRRTWQAQIILAALAAMLSAGCGSLRGQMGSSTEIGDTEITRISARLYGAPTLCPGTSAAVIVKVELADGRTLVTEGPTGGTLPWDLFRVDIARGTFRNDGRITMDPDPRTTRGTPLNAVIYPKRTTPKAAHLVISPRYDCTFVADLSGDSGTEGTGGEPGTPGTPGEDSPDGRMYGKRGGNGGNGGNGADGAAGHPGQDALDAQITFATYAANDDGENLLAARVWAPQTGREQLFLIEPTRGRLVIRSTGGNGGRGGKGGDGGNGGLGGTGYPPGDGGRGGNGGSGGAGADGGNGGVVEVIIDPRAQRHANVLSIENDGGFGGEPGGAGVGGRGGETHEGGSRGASGGPGKLGPSTGKPGKDGPKPTWNQDDIPRVW